MTSRYGSDHANEAAEWMASGFVPVTGVMAACVACCTMIYARKTLLLNVAVSTSTAKQFSSQLIGLLHEKVCQKANL